ncbi:hypothetical protein FJ976_19140 [Mesorhizobium sp. B1-1-9]|uniref:hypothetical protein n=1 Tax=Mesorhizobium sp. B1-1-9 TaxID=2589975 RepID=UPI00112DECC3|nr:hypothetical protein [Mesorhizobium sp. B1-1-9]TPN48518.1 hypothetical protein FJ976_19140 [Mesorhizobium sp. B1-1-9]
MARKKKEPPVRFFTADGVEVETILDLAGPHKDELVKRIATALARGAARRDFLAERGLLPRVKPNGPSPDSFRM